jgi:hypothetical protein
MNLVRFLAAAFCLAIWNTPLNGEDLATTKKPPALPSAKAMSTVTTRLLPIISPNVALLGKAEVTGAKWDFVRHFQDADGQRWQIWKVTGDFSYQNAAPIKESFEVAVSGDEVSTQTQISWGGLFDKAAKQRAKPIKEIDEKAFKAAEIAVAKRLSSNAEFRRANLDRTLRSLIEEEAEKSAEKKK